MKTAYFNRFSLSLPDDCIEECYHSGKCDIGVENWATKIERPIEITKESLYYELKQYGAWNEEELADDEQNWRRLIWIAAGNIKEE